ncbi:MAG: class I SAM-dependent methyltransferase [Ginsengibacter sp.]
MSKLSTAFWFLKNPKYISQIFQVLKRKKNKDLENSTKEATVWCKANSINQQEALKKLINKAPAPQLLDLFPEEIKEATRMVASAPIRMGGSGAITFIYYLVKASNAQKIIETGVAYGWSSLSILLAIKDTNNARLISNDMPYINMNNEDYVGCLVPENLRDKWDLQRLPDIKGIPVALKKLKNSIDFCHYDSDKSYTGRMWATPLIWNALLKNCFLVVDDINDNLAFKHFCESVNRTPVIIEYSGKYVGVIAK